MLTDKEKHFRPEGYQFLAGLLTNYLLCFIGMQVTAIVYYLYMSFETIFAYRSPLHLLGNPYLISHLIKLHDIFDDQIDNKLIWYDALEV